jgi:hypothetical protein
MADYYPLISRAVANLEKNNGESRRALYERARGALLGQLRGVTPALNESDITRERLALEESIRKVEAESARKFVEPTRQPPAPKIRAVEARPREEVKAEPPPTVRRYISPPQPAAPETPAEMPRRPRMPLVAAPRSATAEAPALDAVSEKPERPPSPPQSPIQRHLLRRSNVGERRPIFDAPPLKFRPGSSDVQEDASPAARAEKPLREAPAAPPASEIDLPRRLQEHADLDYFEPRRTDAREAGERRREAREESNLHEDFSEPMLESRFPLDDAHPAAVKARHPVPAPIDGMESEEAEAPARRWRLSPELAKGAAAVVAVIAVAGVLVWQWPSMISLYRAVRAPSPVATTAPDTPTSASRQKIGDRIEPGSQTTNAVAPMTSTAAGAQKVVLYEEDPNDPNGKRFVGSAIWRTETVTPSPGQPPELQVRADVEVPERKLAMTVSLRRNMDKGLPASHTVEIVFKLPTDFPSGGISNVPGILMKQAEQTRGVPLAGLAVKVTNGFFLIGLSNVDSDKERNLSLLKERSWFDIPVVYNNNRRAILAIEKGSPGDRVFAEAFKVWKQ